MWKAYYNTLNVGAGAVRRRPVAFASAVGPIAAAIAATTTTAATPAPTPAATNNTAPPPAPASGAPTAAAAAATATSAPATIGAPVPELKLPVAPLYPHAHPSPAPKDAIVVHPASTPPSDTADTPEWLVVMRSLPRLMPRLFQSYARPMAYASEIGESLRLVAPRLVRPMYALSWLYVIADTGLQTYAFRNDLTDAVKAGAWAKAGGLTSRQQSEMIAYKFGDTFAWHAIASMALPALTVNRTVHFTSALATKYASAYPRVVRYAPAVAALSLIPFVIHPIDHATDWLFDRTLRGWYKPKIHAVPLADTPSAAVAAAAHHHPVAHVTAQVVSKAPNAPAAAAPSAKH